MTCDIIASTAWHCGENDCPVGWHQSDYWITTEGYTVDTYADGDHEDCTADDIPNACEIVAGWRRYYEDCAETGFDPLGQFAVDTHFTRQQTWQVEFKTSIGGPLLLRFRRNGRGPWQRMHHPDERATLPEEVINYLLLERPKAEGAWQHRHREYSRDEYRSLIEADPNCQMQSLRGSGLRAIGLKFLVKLDVKSPNANVERDIRRAAKKALRRIKKGQ